MSTTPDPALRALAASLGAPDVDLSDEHVRWSLYTQALREPAARPVLFDAVRVEPDPCVQTSVVLAVIEGSPDVESQRWIEFLPPDERDYSQQRLADWRRLRSISTINIDDDPPEEWSNWLQLNVAASRNASPALLSYLQECGRTKRVRYTAGENLNMRRRGRVGGR